MNSRNRPTIPSSLKRMTNASSETLKKLLYVDRARMQYFQAVQAVNTAPNAIERDRPGSAQR